MFIIPFSWLKVILSWVPALNKIPNIFRRDEDVAPGSPLAFLKDTVSMVEHHGYHCEEHTTITSDGYFLVMHRIVGPSVCSERKEEDFIKPVALFMHGCLMTSEVWLAHEEASHCLPLFLFENG